VGGILEVGRVHPVRLGQVDPQLEPVHFALPVLAHLDSVLDSVRGHAPLHVAIGHGPVLLLPAHPARVLRRTHLLEVGDLTETPVGMHGRARKLPLAHPLLGKLVPNEKGIGFAILVCRQDVGDDEAATLGPTRRQISGLDRARSHDILLQTSDGRARWRSEDVDE